MTPALHRDGLRVVARTTAREVGLDLVLRVEGRVVARQVWVRFPRTQPGISARLDALRILGDAVCGYCNLGGAVTDLTELATRLQALPQAQPAEPVELLHVSGLVRLEYILGCPQRETFLHVLDRRQTAELSLAEMHQLLQTLAEDA